MMFFYVNIILHYSKHGLLLCFTDTKKLEWMENPFIYIHLIDTMIILEHTIQSVYVDQ